MMTPKPVAKITLLVTVASALAVLMLVGSNRTAASFSSTDQSQRPGLSLSFAKYSLAGATPSPPFPSVRPRRCTQMASSTSTSLPQSINAEGRSNLRSSRRRSVSLSIPLLLGGTALLTTRPGPVEAAGSTPTAPVEVQRWEEIACPPGSPAKMKCIRVYAKVNNKSNKLAPNSELYGYVEYDDGNPALWNDDVKRIANIQNIKPGDQEVTFDLQLRKLAGLTGKEDLVFKKLTARMYFSNMYSAQPLGVVECDEMDTGDCE